MSSLRDMLVEEKQGSFASRVEDREEGGSCTGSSHAPWIYYNDKTIKKDKTNKKKKIKSVQRDIARKPIRWPRTVNRIQKMGSPHPSPIP